MKIRITNKKKALNERWEMTSQSSLKHIINNLFNPSSSENIFNKKLIFYDLETNGFGKDAYVHQIAALEFDLGSIFKKHLEGQNVSEDIKSLTASDGIIVKALFEEENFKSKDKKTRNHRFEFYKTHLQRKKGDTFDVPHDIAKSLMLKNKKIRFDFDPKLGETNAIIGAWLCRTRSSWQTNSKRISDVLTAIKRNPKFKIDIITKVLIETCLETVVDSESATGERYQIKTPWIKTGEQKDSEMPREELIAFFRSLFDLCYTLCNSPYTFVKSRGGTEEDKQLTSELVKTWSYAKNHVFAFTYTENKNFTEYEKFPLNKYRTDNEETQTPLFNDDPSLRPTEKEGIRQFLEYLKSLGKNNYILIGHNIRAFDNSVILKRAVMNKIPKNLIAYFQDSKALDSLNLLNIYVKQLLWFQQNVKTFMEQEDPIEKAQELATESDRKIQQIIKKHKKAKSKLDGLLSVFPETEDKIQTHTADDDCEDLARVMALAVVDMMSMSKIFEEINQQVLTVDYVDGLPTYAPVRRTPSKLASHLKTKFKNDLVQLDVIDPIFAKNFSGKEKEGEAITRVAERFTSWLVNDYISKKPKLNSDEVFNNLLKFRTKQVGDAYQNWLSSLEDAQPEPESELEPTLSQPALNFDTEEEQETLSESILNKWTRMIK